ncbi:hypothetical protein BKA70DRAFT_1186512 [Coprinopsis sp. MPI-PUGE-AT-0042]|nr:hypothetical protein BKA70DRAFT_1186512 [Coprinopsis sp. MPI-PUGE-AT-0042]
MAQNEAIPSKAPLKDDEFYWESTTFQVEDALFKVPKHHLVNGSAHFSTTYGLLDSSPLGHQSSGPSATHERHLSQANFVSLPDVAADEFRSLLKVMYTGGLHSRAALTKDQWLSVLKLSTQWYFKDLRKLAVARLSALDLTSAEKVSLGKRFHLSQWLLAGYDCLVRQEGLISFEDARLIGYESTIVLYMCRQQRIHEKDPHYLRDVFKEELAIMADEERLLSADRALDPDDSNAEPSETGAAAGKGRCRNFGEIGVQANGKATEEERLEGLLAAAQTELDKERQAHLQSQAQHRQTVERFASHADHGVAEMMKDRNTHAEDIADHKKQLQDASEDAQNAEKHHSDQQKEFQRQLSKLEEQLSKRQTEVNELEAQLKELQKERINATIECHKVKDAHLAIVAGLEQALKEARDAQKKAQEDRTSEVSRHSAIEAGFWKSLSGSHKALAEEMKKRYEQETVLKDQLEDLSQCTRELTSMKDLFMMDRPVHEALERRVDHQKAELEEKSKELASLKAQIAESKPKSKREKMKSRQGNTTNPLHKTALHCQQNSASSSNDLNAAARPPESQHKRRLSVTSDFTSIAKRPKYYLP